MNQTSLRLDVQGLRAVAVLTVLLFHLDKALLPGGFIGVDIFFVISGFVISANILRMTEKGTFSFAGFYLARIRRIVPALAVMVALVTVVSVIVLLKKDYELYRQSADNTLAFISNTFFARQDDYFAPGQSEQPLLHTWSIAVEMQFYLLYPLVLVLLPRRFRAPALLALIVGLTAWAQLQLMDGARQAAYFSLPARIPEFLVGGLVALAPEGRWREGRAGTILAWLGILLIAAGCVLLSEKTLFPGLAALPAMIGAGALILSRESLPGRVLSSSPMVWIGDRSYSIYLWHWPVLALIRYATGSYVLSWPLAIAAVAAILLLSMASYRFVETPLRTRIPDWRKWGVLAACVAAVLAVRTPLNGFAGAPLPEELTRYADSDLICHGKIVGDCLRGDRQQADEVLVLGDSHAAQLNIAFDAIGKAEGLKFRVVTASSCVNIPAFDPSYLEPKPKVRCISQIEQGVKLTATAAKIIVGGDWVYHLDEDPRFLDELDAFLTEREKAGIPVALLGDIPLLRANPVRVDRLNRLGVPLGNAVQKARYDAADAAVMEIAARHANTTFIKADDLALFETPPAYKGTLVYMDDNHLNEKGSALYGEMAAPRIADWVRKTTRQALPAG